MSHRGARAELLPGQRGARAARGLRQVQAPAERGRAGPGGAAAEGGHRAAFVRAGPTAAAAAAATLGPRSGPAGCRGDRRAPERQAAAEAPPPEVARSPASWGKGPDPPRQPIGGDRGCCYSSTDRGASGSLNAYKGPFVPQNKC
ncbi:collagen alpha-1(I) chain-like isoform X2 [Sciurus carolinensis]|uniref:collagen alpha-1(I) chain-like isoform X2 n=1 Tax=Sciurus carolinensis TaxID=30640 RepID=UPI001FB2E98D|nr:collagen alpha-1(I) chain-like isoform X2 [Sciurus carolinensis]